MHVFNKQMTLYEVQQIILATESMVQNLEMLTNTTATTDSNVYELSAVYIEYRKQKRILNHYIDSVNIAKTQIGTFELDLSLLED